MPNLHTIEKKMLFITEIIVRVYLKKNYKKAVACCFVICECEHRPKLAINQASQFFKIVK